MFQLTHDAEIPPDIASLDVERRCKLGPARVLTESTVAVRLRLHISAGLLREAARVRLTILAWGRGEDGQFVGFALDGDAVGEEGQHAFEEVVEWCEPVHPALPEGG